MGLSQIESPVEVVGLWQMFRETDFPREVLVDDNIIVLLQPQFIVPEKDAGGLYERKALKLGSELHILCLFVSVQTFFF